MKNGLAARYTPQHFAMSAHFSSIKIEPNFRYAQRAKNTWD
jgi:hypothetical protein